MSRQHYILRVYLILLLNIISIVSLSAQSTIRVQGVVRGGGDNKPVGRVNILVGQALKGVTDIDGRYSILVNRDDTLQFHNVEYDDKRVPVSGQQQIDVQIYTKSVEIEQVMVVAKLKSKKLSVEPTDIEIKGNYFHLKTRFRVPYKKFNTDDRLVVQPTVNDVTRKKIHMLRPVVMDGEHYDLIEHRSHYFGLVADSLERFVVKNTITKEDNIYTYRDSIYIESTDLNNDFKADCHLALVSYHQPAGFVDMVTIANGTVNPLRFFDRSAAPLGIDEKYYIPVPEMELHNSRGTADIEFKIGRSEIDYSVPKNKRNIDNIKSVIASVQSNPDATLRSLSMSGYASPDGSYQINKELSNRRTKAMLDVITESIDKEQLKYVKLSSQGVIEPWSRVAELMERDSLPSAKKVREIVTKTGDNFTTTQSRIRVLPEYRSVISPKYLPRLRRVEYEVDYTVFRPLTIAEIESKFKAGGDKGLSRFEYYSLIEAEGDQERKLYYEHKAIAEYPNFTIYVNREAVRLIESDSVNMKLLAPLFEDKELPEEIYYNQAIMAVRDNRLSAADSLITNVKIRPETQHLINVISVLNGRYDEMLPYFSERGGLNEVLILLCMKRNEEAFEKMKTLMGSDPMLGASAVHNYVLALCGNRNEDLTIAMVHLQIAISIDPSLAEIAKIDSDVTDIYELIRPDRKEGGDGK